MLLRLTLWFAMAGAAAPCIWDYDTLEQETSRFPSALELITGRFPRHSDEFYEWRIADRTQSLDAGVISAEYLDDLAVAHSKLGNDARAIELMEMKEEKFPGLYTTAANLGTFYIHDGRPEQGLEHIQRAVAINPDAHFGREVYQALLASYVIEVRGDSGVLQLPLFPGEVGMLGRGEGGFWNYLKRVRQIESGSEVREIGLAVTGVLGMLRFGNHDSPVLLECLSDLLLAETEVDAKRLAARALLKASYEVDGEEARARYRSKAESALATQTPHPKADENVALAVIEASFQSELDEAEAWWNELRANELHWIETGDDVDARFAESYYGQTKRKRTDSEARHRAFEKYGGIAAGILIVIAVAYIAALPRRS